jgi:hypothetical protein
VANGVAIDEAQILDASAFAVIGSGTIDLAAEQLDLSFATKAYDASLMVLAVPFRVVGPLKAPSVRPDASGAVLKAIDIAGMAVQPAYAFSMLVADQVTRTDDNPCVAAVEAAKEGLLEQAAAGVVKGVGDAVKGVGGAIIDLFRP